MFALNHPKLCVPASVANDITAKMGTANVPGFMCATSGQGQDVVKAHLIQLNRLMADLADALVPFVDLFGVDWNDGHATTFGMRSECIFTSLAWMRFVPCTIAPKDGLGIGFVLFSSIETNMNAIGGAPVPSFLCSLCGMRTLPSTRTLRFKGAEGWIGFSFCLLPLALIAAVRFWVALALKTIVAVFAHALRITIGL